MMETPRKYVKNMPSDGRHRWHDRFRKEYADKFKQARMDLVNKNREKQWIQKALAEDWEKFVKENEEAIKLDGWEIESLIEDSYEQALHDEDDIEPETSAESIFCVNCRRAYLVPSSRNQVPIALCQNCGFYATGGCLRQTIDTVTSHSNTCTGSISFSLEPGTDDTIVGNCETCDLFDIFYM